MREHGAWVVALAGVLVGCAPTLAHPMRVREGVMIEAGAVVPVIDGRVVDCYDGCRESPPTAVAPGLYGSVGWGGIVADHIGLLVGLTAPARADRLLDGDWELGARIFGFATLQADWGALGSGVDLGITGATFTGTAEVGPWPTDYWAPRIGAFFRGYLPYQVPMRRFLEAELAREEVAPAWDVGARVTSGPLLVQYSITVEATGLRVLPWLVEGSYHSSLRHTLSFGLTTDVQP